MKIGIVVATKKELDPFIQVFGTPAFCTYNRRGYNIMGWTTGHKKTISLIVSGVGEIAAAASTQHLIDCYEVDGIINYGVAGGLHQNHSAGQLGIVESLIHTDFDITLSGEHVIGEYPHHVGPFVSPIKSFIPDEITKDLPKFVCASADKFVGGGEPKQRLRREFGADICEMEAAGVLFTCNRNVVPVTLVKAVSDGVDEDSDAFDCNLYRAALSCVKVIETFVHSN